MKPAGKADVGEGERAYKKVSRLIIEGSLKPGVRLVEAQLAERIGMSRTPLREALFRLERDGLVRTELRRGFTVSELSATEARELYSIVAALESLALRQSLMVGPLVSKLREANKRLLSSKGKARDAVAADRCFHECLLKQCENRRLIDLISSLHRHIDRYEHLYMSDEALIEKSVGQHNAIIEALAGNDLDSACANLTENYEFSARALAVKIGREAARI
jgi:DNA-binding GntR family transcriptional regulator